MKGHGFKKRYIVAGVLGLLYIFNYTSLNPVITNQWKTTSLFAALYLVPVMKIFIEKSLIHHSGLELLGKASYNIFLVQMIYYAYAVGAIYKLVNSPLLRIVVNTIACIACGVFFYMIENPLSTKTIKHIRMTGKT